MDLLQRLDSLLARMKDNERELVRWRVAEEREACARLVDECRQAAWVGDMEDGTTLIEAAAKIRARATP